MTPLSGTSRFVKANGLRHHVLSYGKVTDPAVLILPGITSPAATADFIATRIEALGFSVYVPDMRGRGTTEAAPAGGYAIEDYAADVAGLVEALGLSKPIVLGHSMGARIACAWAVTYATHGHSMVIIVDPPLSGPGRGPYPTSLESFARQLNEAKAGTSVEAVRNFYPKWPERELQIRVEVLPSCDDTAVRETHKGFETEDFFVFWRKMTLPAALIYGADSPVVTGEGAADLKRANPSIPLHEISSAGHMVPWDNEAAFFETLMPILLEAR